MDEPSHRIATVARRTRTAGRSAGKGPAHEQNLRALADRLRDLRKKHGLSQRAAAELIGVGAPVVRRIEGGVGNPSLAVLVSVARAFDVSLGYLLGKRGKRE